VEIRLCNPLDTTCPDATLDPTEAVLFLFSGAEICNPGPVPLPRRGFESSIAESGLVLDGVPLPLLPGVAGEPPPILETRAPDRGVTLPLSSELVGDRKSSLREGGGAVSDRGARRGGLTGDAFFDPASLGVNGLLEFRKAVLSVGVNGLGVVPLLCLSRGIVDEGVCFESGGWAEWLRIMT
jgi:hypothetical protein